MPAAEPTCPDSMAMFDYQEPAVLNQPNPEQNTWYDILPETENCRVYLASANIEDTDETLEMQAIISGQTIQASGVACNNSVAYYGFRIAEPIARVDVITLSLAGADTRIAFILEGLTVRIQVRKTTNAGNGNLTGIVTFGVLTRVP